ncbi:MAG: type III pantothenate kinase [Planctomycetia bacterium]|nr:type III pantothenate kinase [Planctomycetia bacterium]
MKPDLVVDVGNTRIKWGRCEKGAIRELASLPHDDPAAWQAQLAAWQLSGPRAWAVSGVVPKRRDQLIDWLRTQGQQVCLLDRAVQLPLQVGVPAPDRVGIDRLLNAVAANHRLQRSRKPGSHGKPAVIVDAGTAVTVDLLSPEGAFVGGAIFPGRRLMSLALHQHTALLPLVQNTQGNPPPVGEDTTAAIVAGVHHAVAGGINQLLKWQLGSRYPRVNYPTAPAIFLTGGDAPLLQHSIDDRARLWPEMTLEGIRLAAEAQP